jgi:hypothetical protein
MMNIESRMVLGGEGLGFGGFGLAEGDGVAGEEVFLMEGSASELEDEFAEAYSRRRSISPWVCWRVSHSKLNERLPWNSPVLTANGSILREAGLADAIRRHDLVTHSCGWPL